LTYPFGNFINGFLHLGVLVFKHFMQFHEIVSFQIPVVFTQFDVKDVRIGKAIVKQPTYFLKVLVGNSNVRFHSFIFFLIKFTSLKLIIYKMENKLLYIYSTFIEKIACTVLQYVKENFNCSPQETVNPDIPLLLTVSAASKS